MQGVPAVDFSAVSGSIGHDLLQPSGRYVGFSNEPDISVTDNAPAPPAATTPHPLDDPQPTMGTTNYLADKSDDEGSQHDSSDDDDDDDDDKSDGHDNEASSRGEGDLTGGKGSFTHQVHAEHIAVTGEK